MPRPPLKEILKREGHAFGPMVFEFFSAGMPAIIATTGADFALFDMEHTGLEFETFKHLVAGCRGMGVAPLARVPANEYDFIARALDMGAEGVMLPMVESRAEAERIVASAHYPPRGRRGAAFGMAHDAYLPGTPAEKMRAAGMRTLVIAQIETDKGLANVEEIAATPGVDVVWVGHFDLTNFLGIPGEFQHPDYLAAIRRVVAAAKANGKLAGFLATDETWARDYWGFGFRMIAYGIDHAIYQAALKSGIETLKSLA
ncbi:MAG TPA: aldolase/citrate lyase family protein [Acetobacteraceae bacterium]|jgi:2-keto-3-deoxy-L-rhamnonate aldolase RhmA|nr:aldolase/citrate lyase family protein [Acetobacteraceae bacterium]